MMRSNKNNILIAAAGSGKTTHIVEDILTDLSKKSIVVTYTLNNVSEIKKKFYQAVRHIPQNVTVVPWFTYLLRDWVRPYQNFIYERRVESVAFVNGQSAPFIPEADIQNHFFSEGKNIYTDKISKFACMCNRESKGLVLGRMSRLYDKIYIDEIQDLAGYDLEVLELLLKSELDITLVGDHRQATYQTNHSRKNKKYSGINIVDKFVEWESKGRCSITYLTESFRCNQAICDLADAIYPEFTPTQSANVSITGHDGIFIVPSNRVDEYIQRYDPQILRYNKTIKCHGYAALNFGDSKGLTFDRVLIFPHNPLKKLLKTGDFKHIEGSAAKVYVAVTRARYSVAFVYDKPCILPNAQLF